jgi:hypothetical protein
MKKFILGGAAVILLGMMITMGSAGNTGGNSPIISIKSMIRYVVTVHPPEDNNICGSYLVVMLNGAGNKVAPPQIYQPGIADYNFYEPGPVREGYRVARLIPAPGEKDDFCLYPLITVPDIQYNNFQTGMSYFFNLYPRPKGSIK